MTATFTICHHCRSTRFVYHATETSGGYHPCPDCNPQPPKPEWLTPMGYDDRIQGDGEGGFELRED